MNILVSNRLLQNVVSNYLAMVWMGGVNLLLIPVYLRYLGGGHWGIVAICLAMQAVFGLLDAGLSQIMPRDIARRDGKERARSYLIYERAYWALGLIGFFVGQLCVPLLMAHWFVFDVSQSEELELSLRLVFIQFVFVLANSANAGYWNGTQQQRLANIRQCAFGTAKHLLALSLLVFWQARPWVYIASFAGVSALEWWCNRRQIRNALDAGGLAPLTLSDFKVLMQEAGALILAVLIGMAAVQTDRIVLSGAVDARSFGVYVIVANMGLVFMQLNYPLTRAFMPKLASKADGERKLFAWLLAGAAVSSALPALVLGVFAPWVLRVWLGNDVATELGVVPLRLILMAVVLNAGYQVIYQKILLEGAARLTLKINMCALLLVVPACILLVPKIGIAAGGVAWVLLTLVQLVLGLWWWLRRAVAT